MTYEETKVLLNDKEQILTNLYPTLGIKKLLNTAFSLIEKALDKDLSEVSQEERNDMNCLLNMTIETVLDSEIDEEEMQVLLIILNLLQNLESAHPGLFSEVWLLKVLSTLLGAKRSLDEAIILCTFLSKRIKGVFAEEDSTSFLSRKFYLEYTNFLEGKTHDESYSVNK